MTIRFLQIVAFVIAHHEGGDSDHVDDPGKRTRYGLSEVWHKDLWAKPGGPTLLDVVQRFWDGYWMKAGCDKIKNDAIAGKLFDLAINIDPKEAVTFLQMAYNNVLDDDTAALKVDGDNGLKTQAAINGYRHPKSLVGGMAAYQMDKYRAGKRVFLAGQFARAMWNGVA